MGIQRAKIKDHHITADGITLVYGYVHRQISGNRFEDGHLELQVSCVHPLYQNEAAWHCPKKSHSVCDSMAALEVYKGKYRVGECCSCTR